MRVTRFENRSARIIALFRAILAVVFLAALLVDPTPGGSHAAESRIVLGGYLIASLILLVVAWRSWWFDQRLAWAALFLDVAVFISAVFLTESWNADFTSPFLAFLALVALSATLRWDWRIAAQVGVIVSLLFVATGLAMIMSDTPLDLYRFARRTIYMLAMLVVLVWFGVQRREPQVPAVDVPLASADDVEALMWRAIAYACQQTGAGSALLAWTPEDEPWTEVRLSSAQGRIAQRVGPQALSGWDDEDQRVQLFDLPRRRRLILDGEHRPVALGSDNPLPLTDLAGLAEGLLVPFRSASGTGLVMLGGIVGPGGDQLRLGRAVARELANAFDRVAIGRLERDALVDRTRGALARDLHDSVAQSLAGACFRLEALRRSLLNGLGDAGAPAAADIATVRDALRREQGHVRGMIDDLRSSAHQAELHDVRPDVAQTLDDAGAHWAVRTELLAPESVALPAWLGHEIQQFVREAVANAARHGGATLVTAALERDENSLRLIIQDDGRGFDPSAPGGPPWSIHERVSVLGGRFTVESGPGARLAIELPVSVRAFTGTAR